MVKKYWGYVAVVSLAFSLTVLTGGCSQKTITADDASSQADAETAVEETSNQGRETEIIPVGSEEPLETPAPEPPTLTILEGRSTGPMLPVYFDFDKSNIRADQKGRIEKNAKFGRDNSVKIVIEGNCDERGTNEYNMALGERRALSAKNYMVNLGVPANKLKTISYGEEKPLNHGHDELSWSENRRADFVQVQ